MAGLCGSVISSVPATNFVAVKARKCDRSLQTSPVWRGLNTADSADSYMTGYSPAALSAPSFSRSVSCEPHQLLLTFSCRNPICSDAFCQRPNFRLSQMRFVPHLNSETLPTHSWKCGKEPPERNLIRRSLNRLQSPGFHWAFWNVQIKHFPRVREGQSSWVHSFNILSICYPVRGVAWFY